MTQHTADAQVYFFPLVLELSNGIAKNSLALQTASLLVGDTSGASPFTKASRQKVAPFASEDGCSGALAARLMLDFSEIVFVQGMPRGQT